MSALGRIALAEAMLGGVLGDALPSYRLGSKKSAAPHKEKHQKANVRKPVYYKDEKGNIRRKKVDESDKQEAKE